MTNRSDLTTVTYTNRKLPLYKGVEVDIRFTRRYSFVKRFDFCPFNTFHLTWLTTISRIALTLFTMLHNFFPKFIPLKYPPFSRIMKLMALFPHCYKCNLPQFCLSHNDDPDTIWFFLFFFEIYTPEIFSFFANNKINGPLSILFCINTTSYNSVIMIFFFFFKIYTLEIFSFFFANNKVNDPLSIWL